ncbi:MAG TPA: hypothetical protein VK942_13250 [Actinomycetes bacterium]|nr:hypothetical protein [Actinomycetes bacterium]
MPPVPDDPGLRSDVGALRDQLAALNRHIEFMVDEKVQTKVETEIAAKGVPREEYRRRVRASGRRTVSALVFLLLVIVLAVGWNRVTLQQAQDLAVGDFRRLIETCRTTGPPLDAEDLAYCESRVPGFEQARQRAIAAAATAKANQQRLDRVEKALAKLVE